VDIEVFTESMLLYALSSVKDVFVWINSQSAALMQEGRWGAGGGERYAVGAIGVPSVAIVGDKVGRSWSVVGAQQTKACWAAALVWSS
jgi:hypothetical protein